MLLGYLAVMLTVVFVSGKDGLHEFLDSSKDLLAFRSVEVFGNFLNGFINVFKEHLGSTIPSLFITLFM